MLMIGFGTAGFLHGHSSMSMRSLAESQPSGNLYARSKDRFVYVICFLQAKVASSYNAYMDADACCVAGFANAQFYSLMPLKQRYVQNPAPTQQQLIEAGYIDPKSNALLKLLMKQSESFSCVAMQVVPKMYLMFYAGDWDSASWLSREFKSLWDDPARGKVNQYIPT